MECDFIQSLKKGNYSGHSMPDGTVNLMNVLVNLKVAIPTHVK